jgi:hypothetical protein
MCLDKESADTLCVWMHGIHDILRPRRSSYVPPIGFTV